ncbi:MAG: hypothetical protein ACE5GN_06755 [Waddliaceae bacterium]
MAHFTGKTVYVLGAGASYHTGAPLLCDFLVKARLLLEDKEPLVYEESFKKLFEWIESLRGSSYYVEFDLDNIEQIFSLAEMSQQLGDPEGVEACKNLKKVILETLDRCCSLNYQEGYKGCQPDHIYKRFIEILDLVNVQRQTKIVSPGGVFQKDTVITFNYDVMLDYAAISTRIEYCLDGAREGGYKILKLHGSTNWARCNKCDPKEENPPQIIPAKPPLHRLASIGQTSEKNPPLKWLPKCFPRQNAPIATRVGT